MKPDPTVTSLLLADSVFRQEGVGGLASKWCVIGIFDQIIGDEFPAIHWSLGVFVKIGNAEGTYDAEIEFVDPDGSTVGRVKAQLVSNDRLTRDGFGVQIGRLPLPKPGTYFVRVHFDGKPAVGDYPFRVRLRSEKP